MEPTATRHPIRGGLYGLVMGLGLALILIGRSVIALGTLTPIIVVLLGVVAGVVWGSFGPAKGPTGPVPAPTSAPER